MTTIIQKLCDICENTLYMKRDDLIPYSFGGNKVRKAQLFFNEIDEGNYDSVITYGSGSSNHCRVIANMAAERHLPCTIVTPREVSSVTFNGRMTDLFGARRVIVPVSSVRETIEKISDSQKADGLSPYFIPGGGHGRLGTQAYVDCFNEILCQESENGLKFDYIFHASGTGTTQAGLICGKLLSGTDHTIVGISIARKCPYGRDVVIKSVKEYLGNRFPDEMINDNTIFDDSCVGNGYGKASREVENTVTDMMLNYGIPLDTTYTGKAFWGMKKYLVGNAIKNKKILFIHTGGTPLFFDYLGKGE